MRRDPVHPNLIIFILATCGITVSLSHSLVIPLVPQLPDLLHTTIANASWVLTSTLLAGAVATPLGGRLGDLYGKRRMMVVAVAAMVAGSALCAVSSTLIPALVGRTLQGVGMCVIPLGISLLRDVLPPDRLDGGVALMSATLGVGGAIGMPIGAVMAERFDWHALFWATAAAGAVALALVVFALPESDVRTVGEFDGVGAAGLAAGLIALLMAVTKGNSWGWMSARTLGLVVAGAVILVAWGWWQLRHRSPIVDLRTTAGPPVLFTNLASVAVGFAMFASGLIMPQMVMAPRNTGYGLGGGLLAAGLALAPNGLVMMLMSPISARMSGRFGARVTLMTGSLLLALSYASAVMWHDTLWAIALTSVVGGAGVGLAYAAMPALIMSAVPPSQTAAANGLNALMRAVGTSAAAAVLSAVLAGSMLAGTAVPSFGGIRATLGLAIGAALLGAVLGGFIPRRPGPARGVVPALD